MFNCNTKSASSIAMMYNLFVPNVLSTRFSAIPRARMWEALEKQKGMTKFDVIGIYE